MAAQHADAPTVLRNVCERAKGLVRTQDVRACVEDDLLPLARAASEVADLGRRGREVAGLSELDDTMGAFADTLFAAVYACSEQPGTVHTKLLEAVALMEAPLPRLSMWCDRVAHQLAHAASERAAAATQAATCATYYIVRVRDDVNWIMVNKWIGVDRDAAAAEFQRRFAAYEAAQDGEPVELRQVSVDKHGAVIDETSVHRDDCERGCCV